VPIYFNAWHYSDANLWASLITEIFQGLFTYLKPKKDELKLMREQLQEAGGVTARAEEEVARTRAAAAKAATELEVKRKEVADAKTAIDGFLDRLSELLPDKVEQCRKEVIKAMGIETELESLGDLREVVQKVHTLWGWLSVLGCAIGAREGRSWRLGWLAAALILAPLLSWLALESLPLLKDLGGYLGGFVKAALGAVAALLLWLRPILKVATARISTLEKFQKDAETARQKAPDKPEVQAAEQQLRALKTAAVDAKRRLADAKAREQQLKYEAAELAPEQRLHRFIDERARSSEYRGQLGLVSLARRDFEELSNLFARKKTVLTSGTPEEQAALKASVDRIVLYVDDLDRCEPPQVVAVLQAVHLLLAFPLFAVVVGVDQRCLRQSLRTQFSGLVSPSDEEEHSATPLDYLEKIFHIPFHLPQMGSAGFANFIDEVTKALPKQQLNTSVEKGPLSAHAAAMTTNRPSAGADVTAASPEAATGAEVAATILKSPDAAPTEPQVPAPERVSPAPPTIGSVPLNDWERDALKEYHPLVRTPRGAIRLLNTYRLVRAGVPETEWDSFRGKPRGTGECRVALLLLAAAAGCPAVAREWFASLRNVDPAAVLIDGQGEEHQHAEWREFKRVLDATFVTKTDLPDLYSKWLDRVERFAF
jgi:KAP family P-loop domain